MRIVNLTPHPVVILGPDNEVLVTIPVSGRPIPRAERVSEQVGELLVDGFNVPLMRTSFGSVSDLPEPEPDTFYIVSLIVREACPNRSDLIIPDGVVRDGSTVLGCRAFASA